MVAGDMEEPAGVETCVILGERGQMGELWGLRTDVWIDRHMELIQSGASLWEWYPSREERGWEIQLWLHMESVQLPGGKVDE